MEALKKRNRHYLQTVAGRFQKLSAGYSLPNGSCAPPSSVPPNGGNLQIGVFHHHVKQGDSESEQIRVCAGSGQVQISTFNPVGQNPIRLNVRSAMAFPRTFERVILVYLRQRLFLNKQLKQSTQLIHPLAPLFRFFHISLELTGADRVTHYIPKSLNRASAELKRTPFPSSISLIAAKERSLGSSVPKGKRFSIATLVNIIRQASETVSPNVASTLAASFFIVESTLARTYSVAGMGFLLVCPKCSPFGHKVNPKGELP
jgi:hypothetical protein